MQFLWIALLTFHDLMSIFIPELSEPLNNLLNNSIYFLIIRKSWFILVESNVQLNNDVINSFTPLLLLEYCKVDSVFRITYVSS